MARPNTPQSLSLTAHTLYAELRDLALALGATENLGETPGSVVSKTIKGRDYLYYQYRDLDGRTRQFYLGPNDDATQVVLKRLESRAHARQEDLKRLDELRAAFVAAGGYAIEHAPMKILKAFADAGVLQPGPGNGVLVGTHAFVALGNLLGVRWVTHTRTQDIDLAGNPEIDIALKQTDISSPYMLDQLDMGFIPVPSLNPKHPSTSYRIRGQELRVDLLTPLVGKRRDTPRYVAAFNAPAQPVRFLDYLIAETVPGVITGRKDVVLVNLPLPERFALHKLLVAESRDSAFATRAEKDRMQAVQLLQVLVSETPDGLKQAKEDLISQGKGWADKLQRGLKKIQHKAPEAVAFVEEL